MTGPFQKGGECRGLVFNVDWIEKQFDNSSGKLYIQATECAVFSGSSRKLSRDKALKNCLNVYKHVLWLDNVLSNPYKLTFICCQFLTSVTPFFRLQTRSKLVKLLV